MSQSYSELPSRSVTAANRIDFVYRDAGQGEVPLVLLQHFRGNLDNWDPALIDTLASARRVITFDNTGVGGSSDFGNRVGRSRQLGTTGDLGGYVVVEAGSLDAAVHIAKGCPALRHEGGVEVAEVVPPPDTIGLRSWASQPTAVRAAAGVRPTELPITSESVWRLLSGSPAGS